MFTGGVTTDEHDAQGAAAGRRHEAGPRWQVVLRRLEEIARSRVRLEAIESELILETDACDLHRHQGDGSLAELLERHLHYSRHGANERIRVAREMQARPQLRAAFQAGALSFAHVRELTRPATTTLRMRSQGCGAASPRLRSARGAGRDAACVVDRRWFARGALTGQGDPRPPSTSASSRAARGATGSRGRCPPSGASVSATRSTSGGPSASAAPARHAWCTVRPRAVPQM